MSFSVTMIFKIKGKDTMLKQLEIPYIGIKIESIPTILKVLSKSANETEFLDYFIEIGKSKKTASEYLASLRNLKLAHKDKNNQTVLNTSGVNLIIDDIELFYKNLIVHCCNHFADLKIVRKVIKENTPVNLKDLKLMLEKEGFSLKRMATLSSFFKLFCEADIKSDSKHRNPNIREKETLEYNQFVKLVYTLAKQKKTKRFTILSLRKYMQSSLQNKITIEESVLEKYLKILQREKKIKLHQVNKKMARDQSAFININGLYYYDFEVI